ncbi:5-oxoprolinase subunit PxpB [Lutimonas saemankumensis]|uniref:5-oxoprolinase subunit PxpB n=1 Tax=Lutimonas saemankumensis TaxID=483016 RepID=UPI001CD79EAB|nr:5-oxoprolinase subunit PxpB [Lutimonas saemankumensis]MCA0931171.1 5-oxoprolinase subunit PxpB [Lutimonas saemankumensis]
MNLYKLKYKPLGSIAVLVEWPKLIDPEILKNISIFRHKIQVDMGEYVLETVPAYNSLTVFFDTSKTKYSSVVTDLKEIYDSKDQKLITANKIWKIPVCYDEKFGLDLDLISKEKKLKKEKIIALHSKVIYDVYFIGFLPGFLYLGGMSSELEFPRKKRPRLRINEGDVAIAGSQTGVYPRSSPGGWNILGNSPIRFFDPDSFPPCFAVPGDKVKFVPIDLETHARIKKEIDSGAYRLESEIHG